jgi:threonine synthase
VNDVVPVYLETGRFETHPSRQTVANAMDVGNPSNFDRMSYMYRGSVEAMRRDIAGGRHDDAEVVATIRRVHDAHGYLLDPHSAIAYLGLKACTTGRGPQPGVFLATAHPAKFHEIVEAAVGRTIDRPAPLAEALARPKNILRLDASLDAVRERLLE